VPLRDYQDSVRRQSVSLVRPSIGGVASAFEGLLVSADLLKKLGPALSSGKGLFLSGGSGNGKTTLAQRMTRAFDRGRRRRAHPRAGRDPVRRAAGGGCEAPIPLEANCGTLVIDDFGRRRCSPTDLLNRWIVPLEHRVDYLRMPDGK
jgi:hypothetical protein